MTARVIRLKDDHEAFDRDYFVGLSAAEKMAMVTSMFEQWSFGSVKYLVVGAYAVAAHARPRATGDIDLWVEAGADNARSVFRVLAAFGAPMENIDERTFSEPEIVFQIGVPPLRIDISTAIDGITFDEAWPNRVSSTIGKAPVAIIGRVDLIVERLALDRPARET